MTPMKQNLNKQRPPSSNSRLRVVIFLCFVLCAAIPFLDRDYENLAVYNLQLASESRQTSHAPVTVPATEQIDLKGHIDPQVRIKHFKDTALGFKPVTDKIGYGKRDRHRYHNMYGQFLLPFAAHTPTMKFLEIGLGCNMMYGAGASVRIWKKLFPQAELWEAEYVKECAEKAQANGQLDDLNVLIGDQGDFKTLDSWIEKSGGNFDIIIDDGGHHNCQIINTFEKMWPQLNPGGYYFIEDLHVGVARLSEQSSQCNNVPFHEYLVDWQKQLIYQTWKGQVKPQYPFPQDLMFVHCQAEACVLHKRKDHVNLPYAEEPGAIIDQY